MTRSTIYEGQIIAGQTIVGRAQGGGGVADAGLARSAGLSGRIVVNLVHFGQVTEMLMEHFGAAWTKSGTIHLTYSAPLYDGEELTPRAKVIAVGSAGTPTTLDVWCENSRGEVLAAGQATCDVLAPAQNG